MNIKRLLR